MGECAYLAAELLEYIGRAYRDLSKAHILVEMNVPRFTKRNVEAAEESIHIAKHRLSQGYLGCKFSSNLSYTLDNMYEVTRLARQNLSGNIDRDHEMLSEHLNDFESSHTRAYKQLLNYFSSKCNCKG